MTSIPIRTRRITYDPKCEELAEYWLTNDDRANNLADGDFRLHVVALAEDIQRVLEDFSLPKGDDV